MVKKNNFNEALNLRKLEIDLNDKIKNEENTPEKITNKDIKEVMLRKNNIPIIKNDWKKLINYLKDKIIGQDKCLEKIVNNMNIGASPKEVVFP